jgi:hypothetical protein
MKYMEQQMQNQIESGMSEAARCYDLIAELKEECLRLESCLTSKTEIANQLKDGLADAFERETNLKAERDALAAQIELHKQRASKLSSLVDELIDHLRYNKTEQDDVLQEFWDKEEAIASVPKNPQQALVEIRVEAGRAGFVEGATKQKEIGWCSVYGMQDGANEYAEQIRQGGAK